MRPAFKSIRLVLFCGALVMTTAIAASPARSVVWPLASRQLARLSGDMPLRVAAARDAEKANPGVRATSAFAPTSQAEAYAPRGAAARRDATDLRPATRSTGTPLLESRLLEHTLPGSAAGRARPGTGRSIGGRRSAAGAGIGAGAGVSAGAGVRSMSPAGGRAPVRASRGAATVGRGQGVRQPAASRAAGNRPANGAPAPADPATPAGALFTEHLTTLPALTATAAPVGGGIGTLTATSVAATPEPSTLLLLGTGVVAAAGSLRRRRARRG